MRLQKFIAHAGVTSRRNAENLILEGRVKVNGIIENKLGTVVDINDKVEVDNKQVFIANEKHYIMYHKPMGEVTTVKDEEDRKTVMDKFRDYPVRLYPVGRLDYNSEGLLILTNDGELTNKMLHPSRMIDKVYLARISGYITGEEARKLESGVFIDGYKTAKAKVTILNATQEYSDITIVIHEGKYRQVRRMIETVNHEVILLRRVRFGPLELGDLPRGKWRRLTEEEIKKLNSVI